MKSIGLDLEKWVDKKLLKFHSSRPTFHGLEMHLATLHKLVHKFQPTMMVVDPIGSLAEAGNRRDATLMLIRLIDFLKGRGITAFFTSLTSGGEAIERTDVHVSSLVDAWLLIRNIELDGTRSRVMYVLKSRGMAHSNELRTFLLTDTGFDLLESTVVSRNMRAETLGAARPRGTHETTRRARGRKSFADPP